MAYEMRISDCSSDVCFSDLFGVSGSLNLTRQGLHWRHVLRAHADYRRANGETSQEHFLFAYEPRVQINDKAFAYGLVQYERDPIIGFDNRYTASAGSGYYNIRNERLGLSLVAAPSFLPFIYHDNGVE